MGYFFTIISATCETFFMAVGSHLTISLGGILFLGFPAAFWLGAYGYAIAAHAGISLFISFCIGVSLSAGAGALFAFFYSRMSIDSFAVISLASVLAVEALIRSWDSLTGGVLGIAGVPRPLFAATLKNLAIVEIALVFIAFIFESFLVRSPFGRSLRALKENKTALTSLGTSSRQTGQVAVIFASLFSGVAGILTASRIQFLDPTLGGGGLVILAQILTIAIIAHAPKTLRLLFTTAVVVLIPEALRFFALPNSVLGYARSMTYGLALIVLIYYVVNNTVSAKRSV
jgi:ABC-type branched-subunit amino acid transport system permease subunit